MSARQIADAVILLAEAYRKLGPSNCDTPMSFAELSLTKKKTGESRKTQFSPDVVHFIGLLLEGFVRHFDVCNALFESFCIGMRRSREDRFGMAFMAYVCLFRYNTVDFEASVVGPLIIHVSVRTRIVDFLNCMGNSSFLSNYATPEWRKHVQDAYVEDFLIPTCLANAAALRLSILTPTERGDDLSTAEGKGGHHRRNPSDLEDNDSDCAGDSRPTSRSNNNNNNNVDSRLAKPNENTLKVTMVSTSENGEKLQTQKVQPPSSSRQLPPFGVREMQHTIPEKKPKAIATNKASDAELRVVEAAKHGKKLSALDDATKAANRAKEEAVPFRPPAAANPTRNTSMSRLLEEKFARERSEVTGGQSLASQSPRPTVDEVRRNLNDIADTVEVRTTKAALKREMMLVQKRKESEEAKFSQRLAALRDDTEFRDWQAQGRRADEEERMRLLQQRKLGAMLTDEEARQARVKQTNVRQRESKAQREAIGEQRENYKRECDQKQSERSRLADEQRQQLVADIAMAVETVQKMKRSAVEDVKTQRQQNEVEMALQAELEHHRKVQMIQKIKEMQRNSAELRKEAIIERQKASKMVNFSAATDDGLSLMHVAMDEMSLVDLKKLLAATTREQERLVEEKRLRIIAEREAEKQSVQTMAQLVMQHRNDVRNEKDTQREEKKVQLNAQAAAAKLRDEQQIQSLQAKLAKRREERKQSEASVKDDERRRVVAAQLLMKDSKAVEKKKLEQMERAAENTVILSQNNGLKARQAQRAISANDAAKREDNLNSAQRKLQNARALSDRINEEKKVIQQQENIYDAIVRKALYTEMGGSKH